jgi:aryl-alcohol dehydrogenase-like predicted oxidoreductase
MTLISLGRTGLSTSRIGLGLAALGRPAYINLGREQDLGGARSIEDMERRAHQMLDTAYAAGIRYVDAARSYGRAEDFLASWIASHRSAAASITIGSKWGYTYTGEWRMDAATHEMKDLSAATLARQIAETRARLGPHLHLYQIHSATLESGVLDDRRVLEHLRALRDGGLAIGLTVTGPHQGETIERALDVEVRGEALFQCVQATWNLLERSAEQALAEAHAAGWGVIVKEALANGRLTDAHVSRETAAVRARANDMGLAIEQLAFAAALANPWAHVVLSGAITPDQLGRNIEAAHVTIDLEALRAVALEPVTYWSVRSKLAWQ